MYRNTMLFVMLHATRQTPRLWKKEANEERIFFFPSGKLNSRWTETTRTCVKCWQPAEIQRIVFVLQRTRRVVSTQGPVGAAVQASRRRRALNAFQLRGYALRNTRRVSVSVSLAAIRGDLASSSAESRCIADR